MSSRLFVFRRCKGCKKACKEFGNRPAEIGSAPSLNGAARTGLRREKLFGGQGTVLAVGSKEYRLRLIADRPGGKSRKSSKRPD
jgi:hypothetical protein